MRSLKAVVCLLVLGATVQASAGSIECVGQNVVASVRETPTGYVLSAKRKVYGAIKFFEGRMDNRNAVFSSSEKSLKTLQVAFAYEPTRTRVAGLNLKLREFYMEEDETAKRLVTETNMNCRLL